MLVENEFSKIYYIYIFSNVYVIFKENIYFYVLFMCKSLHPNRQNKNKLKMFFVEIFFYLYIG